MRKTFRLIKWVLALAFASGIIFCSWNMISGEIRQNVKRGQSPSFGQFVSAGDVQMFVQKRGDPKKDPVIFIHGTVAWSGTWLPMMARLESAGIRTIALDSPPFGYSTHPANRDYRRSTQAARILAMIDAMGFKRVTLVGHSFGARATLTTAAALGSRLKKLVILAGAVGWTKADGLESDSVPLIARMLFDFDYTRVALGSLVVNPYLTRFGLHAFVANPKSISEEVLKTYQAPMNVSGASEGVGFWARDFLAVGDVGLTNDTENIFSRIQAPALLIWGTADTTTPVWQGERLAKALAHSRLEKLDQVGHLPHIEDPDRVANLLIEFLK